jgi:hypothetical protein
MLSVGRLKQGWAWEDENSVSLHTGKVFVEDRVPTLEAWPN